MGAGTNYMKAHIKSEDKGLKNIIKTTLFENLKEASENSSRNTSGIYFISGDGTELFQSYFELYINAIKLMGGLRQLGLKQGDMVIFQLKSEFNFINLFWACIAGGIIPVPLTISSTGAKNSEWYLKLKNVCHQLEKHIIVTEKEFESIFHSMIDNGELNSKIVCIEDLERKENNLIPYNPDLKDIAFIQFSSGSTGNPKGVMLTHENLSYNINQIISSGKITSNDFVANWMPLTHDMGMIGMHLTFVKTKGNQFIISPETFIKRPLLFLEKVTKFKATVFGCPNFALSWLVEKIPDKALEEIDFSSIRQIYNGAEPISMDVVRKFKNKFKQCSLNDTAMFLVYGMAEACLAVTFPNLEEIEKSHKINRAAFTQSNKVTYIDNEVTYIDDIDTNFIEFADVGSPLSGIEIKILDDNDVLLNESEIGNIVIKGPNVTQGYYNNKEANEDLFIEGFLRTGDLGFIKDGRLVITGRKKDVIFLNGQNFFAHDIERICEELEEVEMGKVAACGLTNDRIHRQEMIVFIQYKRKLEDFIHIAEKIKKHVNKKTGQTITHAIPVKVIPRTTSGKLQRYKLAKQYLNEEFQDVISMISSTSEPSIDESLKTYPIESEVEFELLKIWSEILDNTKIRRDDDFFSVGGDSLKMMQILEEIHKRFNADIPVKDFIKLSNSTFPL